MKKTIHIALLALLLVLVSCSPDRFGEGPGGPTAVSAFLPDEGPATRSVLPTTSAYESAVNEATFLSYDAASGMLEDAKYVTGASTTMLLGLGATHHVYCLANMGDLTASAPTRESGMVNVSYTIPSYSSMATKGIPMAGTASSTGNASVPLRRLLAKLIISVDHTDFEKGGYNGTLYHGGLSVQQAARRLYPFAQGGSRARSTDDLFAGDGDSQSMAACTNDEITDDLVLYVPENVQGTLLAGGAPSDKSYSNATLSNAEQSDLCTYVTYTGTKDGSDDGVEGSLTYRFFPGANATSNFSLVGGKTYVISLVLSWNGMFTEGNWKVTRSGWNDSRFLNVSASPYSGYGASAVLNIPRGLSAVPFYVYFNPYGDCYFYDDPAHFNLGWNYSLDGVGASHNGDDVILDNGVEVISNYDNDHHSVYLVNVAYDDALIGTSHQVVVSTPEGSRRATVTINIIQPTIILDRNEVVCRFDDWGDPGTFEIYVSGGSVPPQHITVTSSSPDLLLESYDWNAGIAYLYWDSQNNATTRRSATVTFSGLGASATCTIWQNGKSAFSFDDDDDGGEGDNDYD